jgi:hypothetical protein
MQAHYKNIIVGFLVWVVIVSSSVLFMRNHENNGTKTLQHNKPQKYSLVWFIEIKTIKKTKIFRWLKKHKYSVELLYTYPKSKLATHLRVGPYNNKILAQKQQKNIVKQFKIKTKLISESEIRKSL